MLLMTAHALTLQALLPASQ